MDESIEQQHLQLNRDYLRILDNILFYLDQFNTRYNSMDYFNRERPRNRNRRNRWSFRQPLGSRFDRSPSNTIFRPSRSIPSVPPVIPPPPPPPPLFSNNTFTTPPRISRTFERSFFNSPFNNIGTNTDNLTNFINNTLHVPSRPDYPTFNQVIAATTESTYRTCQNINNQTMCTISREEFNNDTVVLKINHCGHIFKKNSLLTWFETNSRCPVCRHDIRNIHNVHNNASQNTDISNNNIDISNNNVNTTNVDVSGNNLYSPIHLRNNTTQNTTQNINSTNNVFDISNNDLNNILNNNLTQVLDNIGSAVLDNIETMVGNAFNNATDLSNNQINSAEFQYSFQLPPSSIRWTTNIPNTTNTTENDENDENDENID